LVDELQERVNAPINDGCSLGTDGFAGGEEGVQLGGLVLTHARGASLALLFEWALHGHRHLTDLVLLVIETETDGLHGHDLAAALDILVAVIVTELCRVVARVAERIGVDDVGAEAATTRQLLGVVHADGAQLHGDLLGELRHVGDTNEAVGLVGGEQLADHISERCESGVGFLSHGFLARSRRSISAAMKCARARASSTRFSRRARK